MATYKVVTVSKTVYVHNVERVYLADDVRMQAAPGEPSLRELVFSRAGVSSIQFPMENVISYEVVR